MKRHETEWSALIRRKNRMFKSRLEARWAAFFDLVGWEYEYQPFTLNGWTPDFALIGDRETVLVEVVPFSGFPRREIERIDRIYPYPCKICSTETCKDCQAFDGEEFHDVLLLGPTVPVTFNWQECLGFIRESGCWSGALMLKLPENGAFGFSDGIYSFRDRISGKYDVSNLVFSDTEDPVMHEIRSLWIKAGSTTQ